MAAPIGNKYAIGNDGGRPPKFESKESLIQAIDSYFETTEINQLTITGLALHLGFESRNSLYDYEKHQEYSGIIKKARTIVENAYESKLSTNNVIGAIFALKNMGWADSKNIELSGNQEKPLGSIDYDKLPTDTLQAILAARIDKSE